MTNTPYGIRFHIDHNGFSPFVLTWEEAQEEVDARGDLRIRLEGDALQTEETVGIRVQLSDPSVNGTYGDLTFVEGVAETRLAAHATVVAADLPASLRYQVTVPDALGNDRSRSGTGCGHHVASVSAGHGRRSGCTGNG